MPDWKITDPARTPTLDGAMGLTESIVEDAALEWFGELGYAVGHRLDHTESRHV